MARLVTIAKWTNRKFILSTHLKASIKTNHRLTFELLDYKQRSAAAKHAFYYMEGVYILLSYCIIAVEEKRIK